MGEGGRVVLASRVTPAFWQLVPCGYYYPPCQKACTLLAWANVDLMGAHCGIVEKATACIVTGSGLCDECEQLQPWWHLSIMDTQSAAFMKSPNGDAHRKVKFCYTKWLSWACTAQRVSVCFGHNLSIKRSLSS